MYGLAFVIGVHKSENAFISEKQKSVGFEGIFLNGGREWPGYRI